MKMITIKTVLVSIGFLIINGLYGSVVGADDGQVYGGYCAICGRDMPASHDFTHGGGGTGTTVQVDGWRPPVYTGPSPEELERRRKINKAKELNAIGIEYWEKTEWEVAAEYFRKALEYYPGNAVMQDNLRKAEHLAEQRRKEEEKKAEIQRKLDETKDEIARIVNTDFDSPQTSASSSLEFGPTAGAAKPVRSLEFMKQSEPPLPEGLSVTEIKEEVYVAEEVPAPRIQKDLLPEEEAKGVLFKAREMFVAWTKTETYNMTFGRIPGLSKLKSIRDDARKMFQGIRAYTVNLYKNVMRGVEEGAKEAASPYDRGGYVRAYEERTEKTAEETLDKAKELTEESIKSH
ncbi:MAG: hypothetical protein ABIA77_05915 [Candidatus Omnitrophota bacterium]